MEGGMNGGREGAKERGREREKEGEREKDGEREGGRGSLPHFLFHIIKRFGDKVNLLEVGIIIRLHRCYLRVKRFQFWFPGDGVL